jgi:large subunit ribosomal protein L17
MRHQKRRLKLGVKSDHRLAMMRNLTLGLVEHGRIKTTLARAKRLRPFIEPIVTRLKDPTVANIRTVLSQLANRDATLRIAKEISPKFKDRTGGYTRILKLSKPRAGDAADMALIEWVDESLVTAYSGMVAAPKAKKSANKPAKKAAGAKKAAKAPKAAKADGTKKKASTSKSAKKSEE